MSNPSKAQQPHTPTLEEQREEIVAQALRQALNHQNAGELQIAEELYRGILEIKPNHPDANHNLGVLAAKSLQPAASLPYFKTALETNPAREQFWVSYIETLIQTAQPDVARKVLELGRRHGLQGDVVGPLEARLVEILRAESQEGVANDGPLYDQITSGENRKAPQKTPMGKKKRAPNHKDLSKLARLERKGQSEEVEAFAKRLTVRFPGHGVSWKALASALEKQGKIDEALPPMKKAAELLPKDPDVYNDLGVLLDRKVRLKEAEEAFCRALELKPDFPLALSNLGNLYRGQVRLPEAEASLRRAIELAPNDLYYNNLGAILLEQGRIVEAEDCYRLAIKIKPTSILAHLNLGISLRYQGRLSEAITSQRRALELDPENPEMYTHLLFTMNYSTDVAAASRSEITRQFGLMLEGRVPSPFACWYCSPRPERLRVGFVSGDLYNHPVGFFLESILEKVDPTRVELVAYPSNNKVDELTARIKSRFAAWKPLYGMNDQDAARMIRGDGVHVLIDLSGHTSHNRLPMFAWKPAPVQISWLGYFATTGVRAIDYFLADEVGVPEANREEFSETLWYLPDTRLCFSAPPFELPVSSLPALKNGYITFGCFQKLTKVGDEVLATWSHILASLPDARVRWQCAQLGDPAVAELFVQRLQLHGIDPSRVTLHGSDSRLNYLASHAEVDVILDTFPYPGGTTTCEALWMGIPTLTLAGNTLLSRQGASLLTAAGMGDWVANSEADYIAKAIAFAGDLPMLASLRTELRSKVLASPIFDARRFARNFEATLWEMWQKWAIQQDFVEAMAQ